MPLTWGFGGFGVSSALEGRGKECRDLFCFGGSCLDAPIHEEFVIRDAEGICLANDSTVRLEEFVIRDVEGICLADDSTTRLEERRVRSESIA